MNDFRYTGREGIHLAFQGVNTSIVPSSSVRCGAVWSGNRECPSTLHAEVPGQLAAFRVYAGSVEVGYQGSGWIGYRNTVGMYLKRIAGLIRPVLREIGHIC